MSNSHSLAQLETCGMKRFVSVCVCTCARGLATEVRPACSISWHLSLLINNTLKPPKTPLCRSLTASPSLLWLSPSHQLLTVSRHCSFPHFNFSYSQFVCSLLFLSHTQTGIVSTSFCSFIQSLLSLFCMGVTSFLSPLQCAIIKCLDLSPKC